jgi:hypothetical protein
LPAARYRERFDALDANDVQGHYELARWCRSRKRYDLLIEQCEYILKLNPKHVNAKLLLSIAKREQATGQPQDNLETDTDTAPKLIAEAGALQFVSEDDIQVLRFAELSRRFPERVSVRFHNDVLERFVQSKLRTGHWDRLDRIAFSRTKPWVKLHQIVRVPSIGPPAKKFDTSIDDEETSPADAYKDDIEIRSDPYVFARFRRVVLPIVMRGCATSGCHGSVNAPVFRLYRDAGLRERAVYTNFLVLDSLRSGKHKFIDRDMPADSLLLQYLLPEEMAEHHHTTKIKPVVRFRDDRNYLLIADWIGELRKPHTEYPLDWRPDGAWSAVNPATPVE